MHIQTGIYRHFKKGDLYFVEEVRINALTEELMVCYRALYEEKDGLCRPWSDFFATVSNRNNKPAQRFSPVKNLPLKSLKLLLPGTKVLRGSTGQVEESKVCKVFQYGSDMIRVELKRSDEREFKLLIVPLHQYLREFLVPTE